MLGMVFASLYSWKLKHGSLFCVLCTYVIFFDVGVLRSSDKWGNGLIYIPKHVLNAIEHTPHQRDKKSKMFSILSPDSASTGLQEELGQK
jgi:hypothetical protein